MPNGSNNIDITRIEIFCQEIHYTLSLKKKRKRNVYVHLLACKHNKQTCKERNQEKGANNMQDRLDSMNFNKLKISQDICIISVC